MILASLIFASVIAFPKEGQKLPFVERCYLSGAVEPGTTSVVVRGEAVAVHPMGGWVTMIDVVEGTNSVTVGDVTRTFFVARRPPTSASSEPPRVYGKLPYAGDAPRAMPVGRPPSEVTVVIDPGHGGAETGAMSPHNLTEADLNLALARNVRTELSSLGYRVLMTRDGDTTVPLYDRPKLAHSSGASAFVSIHHNAPPLDRDPRGLRYHAVYAWNEIGDALAKSVNARMAAAFGDTLADNGVMHANFAVTRNPEIPSCLVETDFITTPEGEGDSWNRGRRAKVARAIAAGIDDFLKGIK